MKIDGKVIAQNIFSTLKEQLAVLKSKGIIPHLAIILVGNNPASKAYVRQKVLKAAALRAKATLYSFPSNISFDKLLRLLKKLNNDSNTHGIIIQRPLPAHIDSGLINKAIKESKDVDAFHPESRFEPPIAKAALRILENIYARGGYKIFAGRILASDEDIMDRSNGTSRRQLRTKKIFVPDLNALYNWLKSKKVVILGKGETGGGPIIKRLKEQGIKLKVIDSKTKNSELITRNANIIISAVGKPNIIKPDMIKKGAILIGIGIHKGKDGKLHGDYDERKIKDKASFYTPTPGGVGPVNVACLLENLVKSVEKNII